MTASPLAPVRVFESAHRAIIVLNHHRFWDMLLALHRRATRSHRPSVAMPLAAAPYRASGLVRWHKADMTALSAKVCS